MSTMWSTCSMSTGHSCMQAPHVVQSQIDLVVDHVGVQRDLLDRAPEALASRSFGPCSKTWSRRFMISSFGESGLPVFHAGQTFWHRPHSVHEYVSRISFQVRSSSVAAPKLMSLLQRLQVDLSGRGDRRARVLAK